MSIIAIIGAVMLASSGDASDFIAAKRLTERAAPFPSSCAPMPGAAPKKAKVTIAYSVTDQGAVENVRVRETTDACFNDAAIASARAWVFEPARQEGKAIAQEDVETTFEFDSEAEATLNDFDARPIYYQLLKYPQHCRTSARPIESILVSFDVTEGGSVRNAKVVESTHPCLNMSTLNAIRKWKYLPKLEDGKPVMRRDVERRFTFRLEYASGEGPASFRMPVAKKLWRVRDELKRGGSAKTSLEDLAAIEAEFGKTFMPDEMATFHQLRGVARMAVGDNRGALDDFRIAYSLGLDSEKTNDAVKATIGRLEMMIAAEEQKAAGAPSTPQSADEAPIKPTDE